MEGPCRFSGLRKKLTKQQSPDRNDQGFEMILDCRSHQGVGLNRSLTRPDGTSQTAVIHTVIVVPQRLTQFDSLAKNFDLLQRPGWRVRRLELVVGLRIEILVMPVLENRLKNIFAKTAHSFPPSIVGSSQGTTVAARDAPNPIGDPSGPSYIASGTPKHSENPACWSNRFVWQRRIGLRPAVPRHLPIGRLGIIGGENGESRKFGLPGLIPAVDATQKLPGQAVKNTQSFPASIRRSDAGKRPMGQSFPLPMRQGEFLGKPAACAKSISP